jgi:hypothetical protein
MSSTASRRGCGAALRDILRGAFLGDYARDLGVLGAITMAVLGFVPVIGTLCALRDLFANWRHHDRVGVVLNLLAVFPVFGGFPKLLEVIRGAHHIGRAVTASSDQRKPAPVRDRYR